MLTYWKRSRETTAFWKKIPFDSLHNNPVSNAEKWFSISFHRWGSGDLAKERFRDFPKKICLPVRDRSAEKQKASFILTLLLCESPLCASTVCPPHPGGPRKTSSKAESTAVTPHEEEGAERRAVLFQSVQIGVEHKLDLCYLASKTTGWKYATP